MSTKTVEVEFHVAIKQRFAPSGWADGKPAVRVSKGKPACDHDEVAVAVRMVIPASLFRRPQLQATIVVPHEQAPVTITPDIQHNIAQLVQDQLGITLRIEAPHADQE
jgi:hypothetical protein